MWRIAFPGFVLCRKWDSAGTFDDPLIHAIKRLSNDSNMAEFLTSTAGRTIDLCADVASRLNQIAEADLIDELIEALANDRPRLSAGLRAVLPDFEFQALKKFLEHAAGSISPSELLRQLAGPVADIPARGTAWACKSTRQAKMPDSGTLTLALKGAGQVSVRILPGPSYEFKGEFGIAGGLKAPFSLGRVSLSGQRSGQDRLLAKFSHADDIRVLEALSRDLPVITQLNDPESLLDSENFKSARLTTTGKARFGARVKAGQSWMQALDTAGGAVPVRLKADATYSLNWVRTGEFRFTIGRARGAHVRVWLTESRKKRSARSLSIGAEVRIRGLRQAIAPLMEQVAAVPDRLDDIVKTYSQPGALLRDKLRKPLKASDPSVRALADVLAGGGERAAKRFADSLIDAIVESAGARTENWTDLLAGTTDQVIKGTLDGMPIPPEHCDEVAALASRCIGKALDELNEDLLKELRAALRDEAKPITEALAQFAELPAGVSDDLDAAAERCMAPLKYLLARYRALEARIAGAVEAAEKERLAIRYGRAVTRSGATKTLLRLRLNPRDEVGKALYRKMLTGDFADAMAAGMDEGNNAITLESCVFKRVFERKVTSGLTFNLFGREIASRRALSTNLKTEHGVAGQINVFEAEGEVSEEHVAFGEGQSMRVSSLINFITAPDAPDAFAVQLNYTDNNMKPKELHEYLKSLEDAGLIADGVTERFTETDSVFGAPDGERRSLTIDTAFELSRNEFLKIAEKDVDEIARVAILEQLKSYRRIPWAERALVRLANATDHDVADLIFAWRDYSRLRIKRNLGIRGTRMSKTQRHVLHLVRGIGERADELASFVAHWRELDRIGVTIDNDAERLDTDRLSEIRQLHEDVIADLSAWVDARNWLVGLAREDVSPVAAAFMASLRKLSPRAEEPLIPVVTWTEDGDTRRVAVV